LARAWFAVFLAGQGAIQNFGAYKDVHNPEGGRQPEFGQGGRMNAPNTQ
jgi:hypothetical protein